MNLGIVTLHVRADVERLVAGAELNDHALEALITSIGTEQAVSVLMRELLFRVAQPFPGTSSRSLVIRYELGEGRTAELKLLGTTQEVAVPAVSEPDATVRQPLHSLVRALYSPTPSVTDQSSSIVWHHLEDAEKMGETMHVFPCVQMLTRQVAAPPPDLAEISLQEGSDKWGLHFYTSHYEQHFARLSNSPVKVLELGIGGYGNPASGGASLRMWKRYFRRGSIYGVDIFDKKLVREDRLHTIEADLSDGGALTEIAEQHGPFDIVIDDGSHRNLDVLTALNVLFPFVKDGGLYVIEDTQTSYWSGYGGVPDDESASNGTTMSRVKEMLDGLHSTTGDDEDDSGRSQFALSITGVHVYRSITFIDKGDNREADSPSWIPRQCMTTEEMRLVDWGEGLSGGSS